MNDRSHSHSVVWVCHENDAKHPQFSMSKTSIFWDHAAGYVLKKKVTFVWIFSVLAKKKAKNVQNVKLFKRESVVSVAKVKSRSFRPDVFIIFWPPYWFVMDVHTFQVVKSEEKQLYL